MTEGNDVLSLYDPTNPNNPGQQRLQNISIIYAGSGDDVVNMSDFNSYSLVNERVFTEYNSRIYQNITIYGGEGNDALWSNFGDDKIFGGEGNDNIYSDKGKDQIDGGVGNDVINSGSDDDLVYGGDGNDYIKLGTGNDFVDAGYGSDFVDGEQDEDTISYESSDASVSIIGLVDILPRSSFFPSPAVMPQIGFSPSISEQAPTSGYDFSHGGSAEGDVVLNVENIIGSKYSDSILGSVLNNKITGGKGDDQLNGDVGNDTYIYNAGDGSDVITENETSTSAAFNKYTQRLTAAEKLNVQNSYGIGDDTIQFGIGITQTDLRFLADGNNLVIQIGADANNKITIVNQNLSGANNKVEQLKFADGSLFSLSNLSLINEDSVAQIANVPVNYSTAAIATASSNATIGISSVGSVQTASIFNVSSIHGTATIGVNGNINYIPNANFSGVDQVIPIIKFNYT